MRLVLISKGRPNHGSNFQSERTWQVLKRFSRMGLVISMKTTSLATPVGKPGSLVSGRALITSRAFFFMRACAGGSTVKLSISPVGWFTNKKFARPLKSLRADLKETLHKVRKFNGGKAGAEGLNLPKMLTCFHRL